MKKKSVLPFAAVIAIAAAWTFFTGRSPIPMNPLEKKTSTTETRVSVAVSNHEEILEQKIASLFQTDRSLSSLTVHAIDCEDFRCSVQVSSPSDPAALRPTLDDVQAANPWLGALISESTDAQSGSVTYIFQRERPQDIP
jgi:hypothetical protein